MKASILINSYNYARYLPEAIESVLSQSYSNCDLVVIDDGSTDQTDEQIRPRYESNPKIHWFRQENAGQLAAFQAGVIHASGEVCFFLDADDYYEDDYIELMMDYYAARPKADFVFSEPVKFEGERGNPPSEPNPASYDYGISLVRELATQRFIGRPTSAISAKRILLNKLFPFPDEQLSLWKVCADECLVHGSALLGANKHYYGIQRVNYRIHESNHYQSNKGHKIDTYKKRIQINSFVNYMKERLYIGTNHLARAREEFLTIPSPNAKDRSLYQTIQQNYSRTQKMDHKSLSIKLRNHLGALCRLRP